MKKFLSVILTVVMIATVFASVVVVNAADKLQITVDSVEAAAGETAVVSIKLTNNPGLNTLLVDLHYGDLEYVSTEWPITEVGGDMVNPTNKADKSTVTLNWVFLSLTKTVTGDVTFANVTFKVPESAAKGTKFDIEAVIEDPGNVSNLDGDDVPFDLTSGSITVPGKPEVVDTYVGHSLDAMLAGGKESKTLDTVKLKKGDKIEILGWAVFTDLLKEMVYTINGEEYACEDVYRPRPDASPQYGTHAGFGLDNNAMDLLGIDSLDIGTYEISIIARANGGFEKVIKTFTLEVVDETEPEPPAEPAITKTCFDASAITEHKRTRLDRRYISDRKIRLHR